MSLSYKTLDVFFYKNLEKLHFTILRYTLIYTWHHELSKCMITTLNYNLCVSLHPTVNWVVNLDGKACHV